MIFLVSEIKHKEQKTTGKIKNPLFFVLIVKSDEILFNCFRCRFRVCGDADDEFNAFFFGKGVEPFNKGGKKLRGLVVHKLVKIINKNMGDVIVSGMQAADAALQKLITADVVCTCINQPCLIWNVVSELALFFNYNNISMSFGNGVANPVDKLLGLSGTLETHNDFNRNGITP